MTVYNGERYLRPALDSILGQTHAHWELFVVDDGSQDRTWDILAGLAAQDSRLRLLRNEHNRGVPRSLNGLFGLTNGVYITRHDADDISYPDRFSKQADYLDDHPAIGALGTRVQIIDADDQPLEQSLFPRKLSNDEIQEALLLDNCLCQGSVMFRRTVLEAVGHYDESNLAEDYDLWLRMAEKTQFAVLDECLYKYRLHPQSLGHLRRHQQAFHAARALEQAVQRRYGVAAPPERREPVAHYYLRAALAAYQVRDATAARDYARQAGRVFPQVFDNPVALTRVLLPQIIAGATADEAARSVQSLFAEYSPLTRAQRRLRSSWLAEIHMQAVFREHQHMAPTELRRHLWQGLRHQPAWLLNRGVLALLLKRSPAPLKPSQHA